MEQSDGKTDIYEGWMAGVRRGFTAVTCMGETGKSPSRGAAREDFHGDDDRGAPASRGGIYENLPSLQNAKVQSSLVIIAQCS